MADVKFTYRGYEIHFSMNSEEWYCNEIEMLSKTHRDGTVSSSYLSSPKLPEVKAGIDKFLTEMRKAAGVEAFIISGATSKPEKRNCMVVEYHGTKRNYADKKPEHKASTMAIRHGNGKPSRVEGSLRDMMPNTPEALAAFEEAVEAHKALEAARLHYVGVFARIPRLQPEDIPGLVKVYKIQNPEEVDT